MINIINKCIERVYFINNNEIRYSLLIENLIIIVYKCYKVRVKIDYSGEEDTNRIIIVKSKNDIFRNKYINK